MQTPFLLPLSREQRRLHHKPINQGRPLPFPLLLCKAEKKVSRGYIFLLPLAAAAGGKWRGFLAHVPGFPAKKRIIFPRGK